MTVKRFVDTRPSNPALLGLVGLHLFPGALMLAALLVIAPLAQRLGLPPLLAGFGLGGLLVIVPVELGCLLVQGARLNGRPSLRGVILYRERLPWKECLGLALLLLAWLAFVWFALKPALNRFFIDRFFAWMPAFFFEESLQQSVGAYARPVLLAAAALNTLSISLGGAVEELYFRGCLLPRLEFLGRWAPAANTLLFSLYHFWSPWENAARLLALLPFIYTVWKKRSVALAVLVHFTINLYAGISLFAWIWQATA